MGVGSAMMGALIFVVYPNANGGNVTVSPRLGKYGWDRCFQLTGSRLTYSWIGDTCNRIMRVASRLRSCWALVSATVL